MNMRVLNSNQYVHILVGLLIFIGLYLTSLYNYLLFHSVAEIFSIVVICGVFLIFWNTRHLVDNGYLLFISIAYLFIAGIDLLHTLAYKGMGVFPEYGANLPTQLWIAARYVESITLLIAPLWLFRRAKPNVTFAGYAVLITVLLGAIFYWGIFPDCYIEGAGLTPFKKISEYIISLILLTSIWMLWRYRQKFDPSVYRLLVWAIILTAGGELAFTFYVSVYGLSNLIGHFFKIASFYLIYRALIQVGLTQPYDLLFKELKQRENMLQEYSERLEERVEDRTRELKETQEQLIRKEKLAVLGQLASSVAHELRNPLGVLANAVYFLNSTLTNGNETTREYLDIITTEVRKSDKIVSDLLDYSRTQRADTHQKEKVAVSTLVAQVLAEHPPPSQIEVSIEIDDNLPAVFIDAQQIGQVLTNLVTNAYQAMAEKGTLTIKAQARNGEVILSIRDTGTGISPENKDKLFEPLFTTKAQGIGLGLSISKNLTEANGGTISVKSETDQECTFIVALPTNGVVA